MKEIVIATQNKHKTDEYKHMLEPLGYTVYTLDEFPDIGEIIEDGETFEANAYIKAKTLQDVLHKDIIADDSGLMVEALDGAPGVYSARYAGEDVTYEDNNRLLMNNMSGIRNRQAAFITVICLLEQGCEPRYFTGILHGNIATESRGDNGFGYDPIFCISDGRHLAELTMEEKNAISHRALATQQLIMHLRKST
ncbi:RdgB/HAM1 family non-canonical purine NTP pyrophosphatase [Candidatus Xianfuyuplasma coldseepsis]|uniref:dITP/XTP pyrophosphatase n=1 Tax=Candidatus Xianfuyuplasma coldseepsis TaxID=2782163 RepID=A0A7L7KSU2_9MOLU|nr:RdgB/HAM1 family non-canonical purine NTP pyrophosphatase [Xianfuyuplasma coldseepsis]QMS85675.1 RdgB/HAM1 family non-canonical purine NTP pyrophosphatase [Xianfuyuplasma coldseepsis]